jgi:hypothetical protein
LAFEADARRPDGDGGSGLGLGPDLRGETRPPPAAGATFKLTLCATARLRLQPQITCHLSKKLWKKLSCGVVCDKYLVARWLLRW